MMETVNSAIPLYTVAVSLVAVILIRLSASSPNLREFWTIAAAFIKFFLVASMLPAVLSGDTISYKIYQVSPGLAVEFEVDALGIFFALTASFLWIITSFYSIGYVRALHERAQTRYFTWFAVALSATMGVAFSANMFTAFIFYEAITLATFPLVAHKETPEAMRGARRYLVYLLGASLAFQLTAIFLTYQTAGTLDFAREGILAGKGSNTVLAIIFVLFMAGIAKAAMMPFHSWLPSAMVAPTPVSALLHAVAVVKTGVFVIMKVIFHIFGIHLLSQLGLGTILAYVASFTIIAASVIALRQDSLKLMLAYSTISQLSYIILAASLLTPSGIKGSMMHIIIHAFGKITLFFTAGAIYVATHKTKVSELDGIGKKMPFTMIAFAIGALSMIGIPPASGFISKWYLIFGSIETGQLLFVAVIAASTVLNSCYFLPIVHAAFFKEPASEHRTDSHSALREAPLFMLIPLMVTAIGTLVLFFLPSVFLDLATIVSTDVVPGNE